MDSAPPSIDNQAPKEKPVVIISDSAKKGMFKFSFVNPKILGAMTVLLLVIGGVGTGVYLTQFRQQTTSQASLTPIDVSFKPAQTQAKAGEEFNMDVFANAGENQIISANLSIQYDPEKLTLKSINPKQFLPRILIPPILASGSATISVGTDGSSGVSGSGVIASLVFAANPGEDQSSTEVSFDPEATKIQVLNRAEEGANDTFGKAQVTIQSLNPAPSITEPSANQPQNGSDFNGDGLVNSIDLSLMYSGWGNPETETQKNADLNGDGVVNGRDYSEMLQKMQK